MEKAIIKFACVHDRILTFPPDALPGIGHACGHNLIAIASISAALATKHMMQKHNIAGKVVLFGTPAEEGTIHHIFSMSQRCKADKGHTQAEAARSNS